MSDSVGVGGFFDNKAFFSESVVAGASTLGKASDERGLCRSEIENPGVFGA